MTCFSAMMLDKRKTKQTTKRGDRILGYMLMWNKRIGFWLIGVGLGFDFGLNGKLIKWNYTDRTRTCNRLRKDGKKMSRFIIVCK